MSGARASIRLTTPEEHAALAAARRWATTETEVHPNGAEVGDPEPPAGDGWRLIGLTSFQLDALVKVVFAWERTTP